MTKPLKPPCLAVATRGNPQKACVRARWNRFSENVSALGKVARSLVHPQGAQLHTLLHTQLFQSKQYIHTSSFPILPRDLFFSGNSPAQTLQPIREPALLHMVTSAGNRLRSKWVQAIRKPAAFPRIYNRFLKISVAFCSPAKSLTFSGLVENPLGKMLKS